MHWSYHSLALSQQDDEHPISFCCKADGYRVWLDVDQMGGSTLEAMAGAVEEAAVVLIGLSEKYKMSPNCRTGGSVGVCFTNDFPS